jgi:hypothetical protein
MSKKLALGGFAGLMVCGALLFSRGDPEVSLDLVAPASTEAVGVVSIPRVERPGGRMVLRPSSGTVPLAEHTPTQGVGLPVVLWADLTHPQFSHALNVLEVMNERFKGRLQLAFRHLPQDQACNDFRAGTRNTKACSAAYAAQCAGSEFWPYLTLLAKNPGGWGALRFRAFAGVAGVDESEFSACLRSEAVQAQVRADVLAAADFGLANDGRILVDGVPLFLGTNAGGVDAVIRHALGEISADEDGRIAARRLAPKAKKGEVGTQEMRRVAGFFMDAVEASWAKDGSARSVAGVVPANVSWVEASAACRGSAKRLCTQSEWMRACSGRSDLELLKEGRRWPHSDRWQSTLCWDAADTTRTQGYQAGQKPYCVSPEGVFDLTGNLWEWVGQTPETARLVGGSFVEGESATCGANLSEFGIDYSAPWTGFRCCADTAVAPTGAGIVLDRQRSDFALPRSVRGGRTVVQVVANGCAKCRSPLAALADLQSELTTLPVLLLVVGSEKAVAEALVSDAPIRAELFVDSQGAAAGQLAVLHVPTTLVLDADGKEIARMEGYSRGDWAEIKAAIMGGQVGFQKR